jgi:hypothetical protein
MKIENGNFCPLIKKKCVGLKCAWYTQVRGMNPNTGEMIDEWKCAITWMPMMQIETSQQARQAGAAVESFRNEVVRTNSENQQLYLNFMEQTKSHTFPATITPLETPLNMLKQSNDTGDNNQ